MYADRQKFARADQSSLVAIVGDDPYLRDALQESLSRAGYSVIAFSDGPSAIRALKEGAQPALIFLDLSAPQMDGWAFRVGQLESEKLREVPTVVISATMCAQASATDAVVYVRKPVEPERLIFKAEQLLAGLEKRSLIRRTQEGERLRTLGMLLSSLAHELKTPLAYTIGNLELALADCGLLKENGEADAALRSHRARLLSARHGADRIETLINDLLTLARADEDRNCRFSADLVQALDSARRLVEPTVRQVALLKRSFPRELPPVVGHSTRLAQVFMNLLVNAAHAVESGTGKQNVISVDARVDRDAVVVEVSDTGPGICPDALPRVFEPFFTTKPLGQGTGLGLSFCRAVIEGYGGDISVESTLGEGATFRLRLPIAVGAITQADPRHASER